jgi:hypothetical protein
MIKWICVAPQVFFFVIEEKYMQEHRIDMVVDFEQKLKFLMIRT